MSKVIGFFATRNDLLDLLGEVESRRMVHYIEAGMFDSPEIATYRLASQIPDLGVIHVDASHKGLSLLIADDATSFAYEIVPQRRGGVRYAVDQKENPDTIDLIPGGQFDDRTILAGRFGTCTDSPMSASLFNVVGRVARKKWPRIKGNFVSSEALAILDGGGRLTDDLRSPREYDLQR
jgi:hypothetical protein